MILSEQDKTTSILRDLLSESFQKVVVNNKQLLGVAKDYISRVSPGQEDIVSFHNNGQSIFDTYGVTKQVKASFGKTVNLNSGAYLIIEHTEALHVIDVNSGTRSATRADRSRMPLLPTSKQPKNRKANAPARPGRYHHR
jgi:ribonuclease G